MILAVLGLTLLLQGTDSAAHAVPADTYPDSATAALVGRLRAARDRNERLVTGYTATVKQRIGFGVRAWSRDRMMYRQELVARIDWKRDAPSTIHMIGAREGIPVAQRGDKIPDDLDNEASSLVINPAQDYLRLIEGDKDGFVYPLTEGREADYRFQAGDTITISLPTGQRIRLLSIQVIPRRDDWHLIAGTFWFDADSYGLVRAVFRPARPYEFRRDAAPEDRKDTPRWVNAVAEVKVISLEYGLYESRWWMPRYVAIEATATMGSVTFPLRIEREYADYTVKGGTPPPPGSSFRPAGTVRRDDEPDEPDEAVGDSTEQQRVADSVSAVVKTCVDEATRNNEGSSRRAVRTRIRMCTREPSDSNLVVVVPEDTTSLLTSPELGPPILAMGDLINESELRGLTESIHDLPSAPTRPRVVLPSGLSALLAHARYNRVEALSLGAQGRIDLGSFAIRGSARLGIADLVPNGELTLARRGTNSGVSLTGYRRLAAANPEVQPFGPINSTLGLLAQRDDGEYFRTLGTELTARNANSGWWSWRMYVERETPARVETSASIPHLFDSDHHFRPNIQADTATEAGAALTLRGNRPLSRSVALGGELTVDGATGDFDLARSAATVRLVLTPAGPLAAAVSVSAGTSIGAVPVQSRFFLGGASSLRGYPGGTLSGDAYWAGRVEIANSFPAVRLALFSDVGWAGNRDGFWQGRPLIGAGVGASFLDGLLRLDLARGLRAPTGWRLEFYVDGIL
ncbi:MAG: BamA/TamA family outer membrane protein [Gemmatimonadota bacterium]